MISKTGTPLLLFAMLGISSCASSYPDLDFNGGHGAAGQIAYAPIRTSKRIVFRSINPFPSPIPLSKTGVLIGYGSFISPGASWTIVDLNTPSITRIITRTNRDLKPNPFQILYEVTKPLSVSEANKIVLEANAIWRAEPQPHSGPMVTDVSCDVYLFDDDYVVHNFGMNCPYEDLVNAVETVKTPAAHYPLVP